MIKKILIPILLILAFAFGWWGRAFWSEALDGNGDGFSSTPNSEVIETVETVEATVVTNLSDDHLQRATTKPVNVYLSVTQNNIEIGSLNYSVNPSRREYKESITLPTGTYEIKAKILDLGSNSEVAVTKVPADITQNGQVINISL